MFEKRGDEIVVVGGVDESPHYEKGDDLRPKLGQSISYIYTKGVKPILD